MPKAAARPAGFSGFARSAPKFLRELATEMSREWFEANRERYHEEWVQPMTALLADVAARLAKPYAPVVLREPKLFRIHRDTRFSKDKSPYKTHVAGIIPVGDKKPVEGGCAAMYVHLGIEEELVGVGTYVFAPEQLARWRKVVAADKTGEPLAAMVAKLGKAGYAVGGHDDYKKVPKGFPPDHPRAGLLKMKGLTATFPAIPRGLLHEAGLADWIVEHGKKTAPLVTWLHQNVR
ncbi:MAG: DUF2461 domain-containing protein [Deltaproteobacteria bacterium]|nr:DUF2461 domain-containing protein [Deltaproteobacteria bacterium]